MKTNVRFFTVLCLAAFLCGAASCAKKAEQSDSITAFSIYTGRPVADLSSYRITYYEPIESENIPDSGNLQAGYSSSAEPLAALVTLPRKLRWRDTGTVSLILTNHKNSPVEANVSVTASANAVIEVDGANSQTVNVPAGTSKEVLFRVAALGVGETELVFTLRSPQTEERIVRTIFVGQPSLTETVTVTGILGEADNVVEKEIILPSLVPERTGNITVSLSGSRLAMLKEAIDYVQNYPYNGIEQRSARLLPLITFEYQRGHEPWNSKKFIEDEFAEIARSQLDDGSFPYWPDGIRGDVFASLRLAHIAALAKARGINVPDSLDTQRLLFFITAITAAGNDPFIKGYSLWIRTMYGERTGSEISAFLRQGDELGICGWAFAGLAALEMGQRNLAVSIKDRVQRFIDLPDDSGRRDNYWGYDTARYALALMLFQALSPEDDAAGRLAATLIERWRGGAWNDTAASFWALLALEMLDDSEPAEWKAAVSLGGAPLFNVEAETHNDAPVSYNSMFSERPINNLPRDTPLPLRIVASEGSALYYTASLRYGIPAELAVARDEGLSVLVETFDSENLPVRDGRLRAGKTYTRRITVFSPRDRAHLILRAPVPSGAEIVDAAFPVYFIMDDEARFHWDFFTVGKQQVEFRFRAVTPGVYPTPPASAECIYEQEIFGGSAGELIRID